MLTVFDELAVAISEVNQYIYKVISDSISGLVRVNYQFNSKATE